MAIIRNSAKCTACGIEIESTFRHDFNGHYCKVKPTQATMWENGKLVELPGQDTYRFAVDGGKSYIRRVGEPGTYMDTSIYE